MSSPERTAAVSAQPGTMPESMAHNIDRRSGLDTNEFVERYLVGNTPVLVTDAMERWTLFRTPEELAGRFGNELVQVYNDLFDLTNVTPLKSYLQEWFGKSSQSAGDQPLPYVRWYTKMKDMDFVWADEAFKSFANQWSLPYFLPSTGYLLPSSVPGKPTTPTTDLFPGRGLFISGTGACTRLHRDPWASDAVLCQLYGEKQLRFYRPEQPVALSPGMAPAAGSPASASAEEKPWAEITLKPGEVVFIPRAWPHYALSLTDSISLTWNFVHVSTWRWFFKHLASPQASGEMAVLRFFAKLAAG